MGIIMIMTMIIVFVIVIVIVVCNSNTNSSNNREIGRSLRILGVRTGRSRKTSPGKQKQTKKLATNNDITCLAA